MWKMKARTPNSVFNLALLANATLSAVLGAMLAIVAILACVARVGTGAGC